MENVIETEGLTKLFGRLVAVDELSMNVPEGSVFGFLGPNGAGKTTTIRLLTSLLHPNKGKMTVLGKDVVAEKSYALEGVGCMVEDPAFYEYLSARKNVELFGEMRGGVKKDEIDNVLSMVGLSDRGNDKVKTYSHGMKQRLGIAVAMLSSPTLLILDEPTSGLDPKGMVEVREIIKELAQKRNVTIFLSSHLLHEVFQVCTHVCVINKGRHIVSGRVDELLAEEEETYQVRVSDVAKAEKVLTEKKMKAVSQKDALRVSVARGEGAKIASLLVSEHIDVLSLIPQTKTLETFFLEVTEDGTDQTGKD
jgi:ABC-2 type transport system ATP-binding protein